MFNLFMSSINTILKKLGSRLELDQFQACFYVLLANFDYKINDLSIETVALKIILSLMLCTFVQLSVNFGNLRKLVICMQFSQIWWFLINSHHSQIGQINVISILVYSILSLFCLAQKKSPMIRDDFMKFLAHFRRQIFMIVHFPDMLEALVPVSHLPLLVLLEHLEYYKLLGKTKFIQE